MCVCVYCERDLVDVGVCDGVRDQVSRRNHRGKRKRRRSLCLEPTQEKDNKI